MANTRPNAHPDSRPLSRVVIAFDLDNTLLDPTGTAYERTTDEFLPGLDLGLSLDEARRALEVLRSWGPTLGRIGLANPVHRRGHPEAIAVFQLIFNNNPALAATLGIDRSEQAAFRTVIDEAVRLDGARRADPNSTNLEAEVGFRRFVLRDERVERLRSTARRIADHPKVLKWAELHRTIEVRSAHGESGRLLAALASKGAIPIVVTKGYRDVQFDKLDQLGIRPLLTGRVLTTEAARDIPGLATLDDRLDQLFNALCESRGGRPGEDLCFLWRYRCVADDWASKTPSFYGRCLHAIQESPGNPESAMARPAFVPAEVWRERPLHFVMVGDRYDTDVAPIVDLLGPAVGVTLHVRMGKYRRDYPEAEMPADRRPARTFTDWESLGDFLTGELSAGQVPPILSPPPMVDRRRLTAADIDRGLTHEFEAVRLIARLASATS